MEFCKVNKKLLPVKIHYFLLNGAHAGVIPFIPVYAVQLGISASAMGIVLAVLSCLTVVSKAAFGGIVDHFQKLKQVVLFLIIIDVAADLGLNFIPRPHQEAVNTTSGHFLCYQEHSFFVDFNRSSCENGPNSTNECSNYCVLCQQESKKCLPKNDTGLNFLNLNSSEITNNTSVLFRNCLRDEITKCTDACFDESELCESVTATDPPLQLCLLSIFVTLVFVTFGSIVSLTDAACFNALGDQPQNYGRQRMWGTIGWGTFGFFIGYLNQVFTGSSNIYNFSSGFYMLVILYAIDLAVIPKLHLEDVTVSKNICKDVGVLFVKPKLMLFITTVFGIGIVTGISRSYLYWYLRTTLGASQLVLGCTAAIQCFFGELPFFFFSGLIINKLGHVNTFTMSFVAYGVKFLSHSFLTNPWWALPVELLQGPCFGSFYSAMTSYSKRISPKGTEATMQGIVGGTFEGLGVATGNLLAGFCISNFGGRNTFYWTGLLSLSVGFAHWSFHQVFQRFMEAK